MGDHVNNQHTVPQFLLRHFSSDEKTIWSYDKQHKQLKNRSIESVTVERNIYDVVPGQKEGSYEYLFQKAETEAAPIIKKIIEQGTVQVLSNDDKAVMALFVAMQLRRTTHALNQTERFNLDLRESISEFIKESGAEIDMGETDSKKLWQDGFSDIPYFAILLTEKVWHIFKSDNKFYTSDNPVITNNSYNKSKDRGTRGLRSIGVEIYFPLSPSIVLALLCEHIYDTPALENVEVGHVEYLNAMQVSDSNRFIFSYDNNLELAKDMVDKGEAVFNPNQIKIQ